MSLSTSDQIYSDVYIIRHLNHYAVLFPSRFASSMFFHPSVLRPTIISILHSKMCFLGQGILVSNTVCWSSLCVVCSEKLRPLIFRDIICRFAFILVMLLILCCFPCLLWLTALVCTPTPPLFCLPIFFSLQSEEFLPVSFVDMH